MRRSLAVVALVLLAGCSSLPIDGDLGGRGSGDGELEELWVSDTGRDVGGNHHAPVAGRVAGHPLVFAPVSGEGNTDQCALVALNGDDGTVRWQDRVPPANCTIHAVADPTLADVDDDGTPEVVAATTERAVTVSDPLTGEPELRHELSSYGYTRPLVADVTGDGRSELLVVDVRGSAFAIHANGTELWSRPADTYTWGQPAVADFDADGAPELAVALGSGRLSLYDAADGTEEWNRSLPVEGSVTWTTTGQADADPAREIAVATARGEVLVFDGRDGAIEWRREFGAFAAVHALGDGDGDGHPELYATARDGKLRGLNATDGSVEWTTTLTTANVQMTPPPAMGDLDGDGAPELVAVTNTGKAAVVDPTDGTVLATHTRNAPVYARPELADVDGDGALEAFVMYGDGQVAALSYDAGDLDGE